MRRLMAAWVAVVMTVVVMAAPAYSGEQTWSDPEGGDGSMLDLASVKVRNTSKGVRTLEDAPG
jgi:hypothetical protein